MPADDPLSAIPFIDCDVDLKHFTTLISCPQPHVPEATSLALSEKLDKLKLLCSLSQQKSAKPQVKSLC